MRKILILGLALVCLDVLHATESEDQTTPPSLTEMCQELHKLGWGNDFKGVFSAMIKDWEMVKTKGKKAIATIAESPYEWLTLKKYRELLMSENPVKFNIDVAKEDGTRFSIPWYCILYQNALGKMPQKRRSHIVITPGLMTFLSVFGGDQENSSEVWHQIIPRLDDPNLWSHLDCMGRQSILYQMVVHQPVMAREFFQRARENKDLEALLLSRIKEAEKLLTKICDAHLFRDDKMDKARIKEAVWKFPSKAYSFYRALGDDVPFKQDMKEEFYELFDYYKNHPSKAYSCWKGLPNDDLLKGVMSNYFIFLLNVLKYPSRLTTQTHVVTSLEDAITRGGDIGKVFDGCAGLALVVDCRNATRLDLEALPNQVKRLILVGEHVTEIGDRFLSQCVNLRELDLSSFTGLQKIGSGFLSECKNLGKVTAPADKRDLIEPLLPKGVGFKGGTG